MLRGSMAQAQAEAQAPAPASKLSPQAPSLSPPLPEVLQFVYSFPRGPRAEVQLAALNSCRSRARRGAGRPRALVFPPPPPSATRNPPSGSPFSWGTAGKFPV